MHSNNVESLDNHSSLAAEADPASVALRIGVGETCRPHLLVLSESTVEIVGPIATATFERSTSNQHHGYRTHVRCAILRPSATIADCEIVSSLRRLSRRYYPPKSRLPTRPVLMRRDSNLTYSLTTRSADRARTPAAGDGTRKSVWVSAPPRPPLRATTSTRSAHSPAWSPSVAVSLPEPSCPPRCTVRQSSAPGVAHTTRRWEY
jgi:hypothetical protein